MQGNMVVDRDSWPNIVIPVIHGTSLWPHLTLICWRSFRRACSSCYRQSFLQTGWARNNLRRTGTLPGVRIEKRRVKWGGGYFGLIVSVTVPEVICTYFSPQRELISCITVRTWQCLLLRRAPDRISPSTSDYPVRVIPPLLHTQSLTFSRLMTYMCVYIYIYISYRTSNLQMLHFIYLFNKYTYWIF